MRQNATTADTPFSRRFALVLPRASEESWREAGWRTNLMAARAEAQRVGKPIFLWVMVGNPQGCT